jgi:hypothetical protein
VCLSEVIVQQTKLLYDSKLVNDAAMKQFIGEVINDYIASNTSNIDSGCADLQLVLQTRDRSSIVC